MKTINRLKELGFTCLCPVVVGGEKDKSPETVKGEWFYDWDDQSLATAKRIGAYHKNNNIFDVDVDDKTYRANNYLSVFPDTFTVGKRVGGQIVPTHKIYKYAEGNKPKHFEYPKNAKKNETVVEILSSTQTIIAGEDRIIINDVPPSEVEPSTIRLYAKLMAIFRDLEMHWANEGERDKAHFELAGFFASKTNVPVEIVKKFVMKLCERTNDTEYKKRLEKYQRQYDNFKNDPTSVTGTAALIERLGNRNMPALDLVKNEEQEEVKKSVKPYPLVNGFDLANALYPEPQFILAPILRDRTITQISGDYGSGKTHFGLSIALSVAHGLKLFDYKLIEQRPILYVEGELPANDVRDRINCLLSQVDPNDIQNKIRHDYQYTLTLDDLFNSGIDTGFDPIACTNNDERAQHGRDRILKLCEAIKERTGKYPIVFLDNISALTDIKENDAQDWSGLVRDLVKMKNRGISSVIFHHTNKSTGTASGSNMSQRLIDTHIILRKLKEDQRFEISGKSVQCSVHFDKFRNFGGTAVQPFMATCDEDGNWKKYPMLDQDTFRILELINGGASATDIQEELSISKTTYYRKKEKLEEAKLIETD